MRLAAVLAPPVQKPGTEIPSAEPLEVHGQEGGVEEHVPVAEPVVELEAVEDARTVRQAEHVVGQQIAVTVPDPPAPDPMLEQLATAGQVAPGQTGDLAGCLLRQPCPDEPGQSAEVSPPCGRQCHTVAPAARI